MSGHANTMSNVIIVLGRGIKEDGSLPPDPRSRVEKAVELYQQGVAPIIIMSGAWTYHFAIQPKWSEATAMKKYAIELGVPAAAIIEESKSMDTIGNVYFTKKQIAERAKKSEHGGLKHITVVASDEHMPRIRYLFEKIYGPTYRFDFVVSKRVIDDAAYAKELQHEQNSMAVTHQWLDVIKDGDDTSVFALMLTRHPAYMLKKVNPAQNVASDVDLHPDAP